MQRENEGGVLITCRKQEHGKRGPVLFLCIVPFSCLWFKIQKFHDVCGKEDVESMTAGFRVREQKFICGKNYATADTMQVDFFEITEQQHKASTRKKKELASSIAKEAYNLRKSGRYLELLVQRNFHKSDYSVTYTYDNEHRPDPADTKRVDKDFSAAMKKLYRMCDKKGIRHPKWIVVHEYSTYVDGVWVGKHHHHIIMQRVYGLTREMVEEAWSGRGMARCEPLHFDHGYITSLAKYIMKNVRCKRHWRQSRGLKPPKMPRPNDGKMSRTKLKDVCENRLEDRAFWEKMYPGYTLHYCEPIITGNNTRHLIVRLYRKETGLQQTRRNQP